MGNNPAAESVFLPYFELTITHHSYLHTNPVPKHLAVQTTHQLRDPTHAQISDTVANNNLSAN